MSMKHLQWQEAHIEVHKVSSMAGGTYRRLLGVFHCRTHAQRSTSCLSQRQVNRDLYNMCLTAGGPVRCIPQREAYTEAYQLSMIVKGPHKCLLKWQAHTKACQGLPAIYYDKRATQMSSLAGGPFKGLPGVSRNGRHMPSGSHCGRQIQIFTRYPQRQETYTDVYQMSLACATS